MMKAAEVWASEKQYTHFHLRAKKKGPVIFYQKLDYKPIDGLKVNLDSFDEKNTTILSCRFVKKIAKK